jgi:hypothetical protein
MELSYQLFVGSAAAVFAGLINALIAPVYVHLRTSTRRDWQSPSFQAQLLSLAAYLWAGIGIGLLFWLSWGLAAVVGVPWWQRGAAFGLLVWGAVCVPLLAIQRLATRTEWQVVLIAAIEWLITLVVTGLACAWGWAEGP